MDRAGLAVLVIVYIPQDGRVPGECPWSTGAGHDKPWGYDEKTGLRGTSQEWGTHGPYECYIARYCGHDGCSDREKPPQKEEPRVTGEMAREYRALRTSLKHLAAFAHAYAVSGDVDGLCEELTRRADLAMSELYEHPRCAARHPDGVWSCDRPQHDDQWHVSDMSGCWPESPSGKEEE